MSVKHIICSRAAFLRMRRPNLSPALALFLLSPAIGELLSGSSPPSEFFTPFGLVVLLSLYGGGAVLIRELSTRWGKGMASVLLMGAAYGVIEEGFMVSSFFNPAWQDLGQLGVYGRWLGVNWVWAVMLTIYHSVYSIAVPIILVELAWPELRSLQWLSGRTFKVLIFVFVSVVAFGFLLFVRVTGYTPAAPQYLSAIGVASALFLASYAIPSDVGRHGKMTLPRPLFLWGLGATGSFVFFLGFWSLPSILPLWSVGIFFGPTLVLIFAAYLSRYRWGSGADRHLFSLVAGGLTFFMVFAPLQEMDSSRTDNPTGMSIVALVFVAILLFLKRRIWSRYRTGMYRLFPD